MKLMKGSTPIKKTMIHNDTQDATMVASDLQAGVTAYAKGQKIVGTGKTFEFASYGSMKTNRSKMLPSTINVIEITCLTNPVQHMIALSDMKNIDFSVAQTVGNIVVDGVEYPINVQVSNNKMTISCEVSIFLEIFYGKDNYI